MDEQRPSGAGDELSARAAPRLEPSDRDIAVELRTAATVISGSAQNVARRARRGDIPSADRLQRYMAIIEQAARRVVDQARTIERRGEQRR